MCSRKSYHSEWSYFKYFFKILNTRNHCFWYLIFLSNNFLRVIKNMICKQEGNIFSNFIYHGYLELLFTTILVQIFSVMNEIVSIHPDLNNYIQSLNTNWTPHLEPNVLDRKVEKELCCTLPNLLRKPVYIILLYYKYM